MKRFDFVIQVRIRHRFDVIGLDPIADVGLPRHKKLFREKDIVNIENLKNLGLCGEELFSFSCFPLKLEHCDGSPVRAVAWFEEETDGTYVLATLKSEHTFGETGCATVGTH